MELQRQARPEVEREDICLGRHNVKERHEVNEVNLVKDLLVCLAIFRLLEMEAVLYKPSKGPS